MSIIGTRPPLISETNLYELHHRARLDSDDTIEPYMYEKLYGAIYNDKTKLSVCAVNYVYENGEVLRKKSVGRDMTFDLKSLWLDYIASTPTQCYT